MFMAKLGMGLVGTAGKALLKGGTGKAVAKGMGLFSQCGKSAGKGRGKGSAGHGRGVGENPLEELLALLPQKTRSRDNDSGPQTRALLQSSAPDSNPNPAEPMELPDEMAAVLLSECISSFIDGRVRLRHPLLKEQHRALAFCAPLLALEGIKSIDGNPRTGSALICYDTKQLSREQLMTELLSAICRLAA